MSAGDAARGDAARGDAARSDAASSDAPGGAAPVLDARGVRLAFGPTPALRGVDLAIAEGEAVAIMGPSGSGKSTLLHVLAGVLVPDAGEVRYRGERLSSLDDGDRSDLRLREFGFVFQFGQLVGELSALDNVALPLMLLGARRWDARRRAHDWLGRLGVGEHAAKRPGELSGGQAQRAAVARALVTRPRILFADEPTGSLDSLAAEQTMTALMALVREDGTTLVLVTHDARTAAYADREVIVRDGRVSFDGGGAVGAVGAARTPSRDGSGQEGRLR